MEGEQATGSNSSPAFDESQDLPPAYANADTTAIREQRVHLALTRVGLWIVLIGATASVVASAWAQGKEALSWIGAVLLIVGVFISLFLKASRPDAKWFRARAVAESIKTIAWRYAMGATPYDAGRPLSEVDARFGEDLTGVLLERSSLGGAPAGGSGAGDQITDWMRNVRVLSVRERLEVYLVLRVSDQALWYDRNAASNARSGTRWFGVATAAQVLAAVSALGMARCSTSLVNLTPLLTTVATTIFGWAQVKRHEELSSSYALACHELSSARNIASRVGSDAQLAEYVNNVERAISREHTMWVARRVTP